MKQTLFVLLLASGVAFGQTEFGNALAGALQTEWSYVMTLPEWGTNVVITAGETLPIPDVREAFERLVVAYLDELEGPNVSVFVRAYFPGVGEADVLLIRDAGGVISVMVNDEPWVSSP